MQFIAAPEGLTAVGTSGRRRLGRRSEGCTRLSDRSGRATRERWDEPVVDYEDFDHRVDRAGILQGKDLVGSDSV